MENSEFISLQDVESPFLVDSPDKVTLKGVNLNIFNGEIFGIIGRQGSGKSSLLRTIGLIERPVTGVVSIDNKTTTVMADKEYINTRRQIGYVNQDITLLETQTVLTNVKLPLQVQNYSNEQIIPVVQRALDKVELTGKTNAKVNSLSSLEKIKVSIASCMTTNPKIILLDEVFNKDQKNIGELCRIIRKLNKENNITFVLITNDVEVIKSLCTRIAMMQQGKIVEVTDVKSLFLDPESEVAKDFIRVTTRSELPWSFKRRLKLKHYVESFAILRVCFATHITPEDVLTKLLQEYPVRLNIIQAYQESLQGTLVNVMIIEMHGEEEVIIRTSDFLRHHELPNEIIGYVANTN